jgi:Taurine catabolism dioxygenase TauD, TfdA family
MAISDMAADTSMGWRGDSLQDSDEWLVELSEADLDEFKHGVEAVASMDVLAITREDFPLPRFSQRLRNVIDTVENGRGFAVIRGLPVYQRFSEEQCAKIFWSIGLHAGRLVPQDRDGQLLGTLRDLGARGAFQRTYATNEAQGFHQDGADIVALLCLRQSLYGGDSLIASTLELYRTIVEEHPEYVPLLHKNFATDWKSEEPLGSLGWYEGPLFSNCEGALSGTVQVKRIIEAQRFSEVPRLTGEEVTCMMYIQSLLKRPGMALTMRLQPGDMQFVSNYTVLHARTSFVDSPDDPEYQRALLRLWITPEQTPRPLCPEYAVWRDGYAR